MANTDSYAKALGAQGIDPESFSKVAPGAVGRFDAEQGEAIVRRLAQLAEEVHAADLTLYFAFEFCAAPLSEVLTGHPDGFLKAIDDLAAIATSLGDDASITMQRGIPALCHQCKDQPWVVTASMDLARELGAAGIDPGTTLQDAVVVLARVAGEDRDGFAAGLDSVRRFVLALDERGMHPTYPIQQGLCGTIEAWGTDLDGLDDAIGDLRDLAIVLQDAGLSPYPVLEYGVSAALPAAQDHPWLRAEIFPLAATLGAQGIDPILLLNQGILSLASLPVELGSPALKWAQEAAADGVDPGWFLAHSMGWVTAACSDTEDFERALQGVGALARAIEAHDHQPMLTFEYGLPSALGNVDLHRLLAVATSLAVQGTDPGPPLNYGFGTLGYACAELPLAREAAFAAAEALVADGRSPWRMLENGVPAAVAVADKNDDAAAGALVRTIGDLITDLHREGIETDDLLMYGIDPLAKSCSGDRALFEDVLSLLRDLVADLASANLSLHRTVGSGLPAITKVSKGDPARLRQGTHFARGLALQGIDPGPFLVHAIPALGFEGLDHVSALIETTHRANLPTEPLGSALAALRDADPDSRVVAMTVAAQLAEKGVDPSTALSSSLPALIESSDAQPLARASGLLGDALVEAHGKSLPADEVNLWAFQAAIQVAQGTSETLESALASAVEAGAAVAAAAPNVLQEFLRRAPGAAASVAGQRAEVFGDLLQSLAQWTVGESRAPGIEAVLREGLVAVADAARDQPQDALRLLPQLAALASLDDAADLCAAGLPMARIGAAGDADVLSSGLKDLYRIGAAEARRDLYVRIERLTPLAHRLPETWSDLVVPVCLGVGAGAPAVLDCVHALAPHFQEAGDLTLIKAIVTQQGLRAPDILSGLLYAGLRGGQIRSISEDRELLQSFISEVPFADPDYYAAYRRIMTDPELSAKDRRSAVGALEAALHSITEAVVCGEVSKEQEGHPLFAQALAFIFPPSRSASRDEFLRLYRRFPDSPEHLEALRERGPLPSPEIQLATGGYRIRAGETIDKAPWEPLSKAVADVAHGGAPGDPAALGEALFDAWIAGHLARPRTRDGLLARIYGAHCAVAPGLPDALDDAGGLLKYREFLSDTAREIIQDALAAFRATDPERYERLAHAKLAPKRRIGKGLLRSVTRTCQAHRDGDIDRDTLEDRLGRQLRGFDLEASGSIDALLGATESSLVEALDDLPRQDEDITLGEEHHRVLADLTGSEIAAMGRELFGDGQEAGKVEYSAESGGPELALRIEPTKRRAHAPIGLCEGVCTAIDLQLWQTLEFLQCVIWGPDRRARGGMHLLRVERTVSGNAELALALPGINPTLELLREVGPDAVLDALLAYAKKLAAAWKLDEVWIPTHRGIASNRGPILQALNEREFERRSVKSVTFSYSPYGYSFDEVWLVP